VLAGDGNGRAPARTAALSRRGRNSARRPGFSWRMSRYCCSAGFPAISSSYGAGGYRSCSASAWSRLACGSASASLETPVFRRILDEEPGRAGADDRGVPQATERGSSLTALLRLAEQSPGYIFNAFIFTYGTQVLGASRDLLLIGLITTTALGFHLGPDRGRVVRQDRPPADVHHRLRVRRGLHLRLLRDARHQDAGDDLHRGGAVVHPGHDDVRTRGRR